MNARELMKAYGLKHQPGKRSVVKRNGVISFVDYDAREPRVPKGQAGAGQWTSGGLGAIAQQFAALGLVKEFPPATTSKLREQSREQVEKAVAKGKKRVDAFAESKAYASGDVSSAKTVLGRIILDAAKEIEGHVRCSLGSDGEALAEFGSIYRNECQKYFHTSERLSVGECVRRARAQLAGMLYARDVLADGRLISDWDRAEHTKINQRKNAWLYLSKEKAYIIDGKVFKCTVTVVKEDPYRSNEENRIKRRRDVYNVKGIVSDAVPMLDVLSVTFEEV